MEAQNQIKRVYDKNHREREFDVGDWVYVKLHPYHQTSLTLRKVQKLGARYFGPSKILRRIRKVELPEHSKIHPTFHVSLLKKYFGDRHQTLNELPTVQEDETLHPFPHAILDRRTHK